MRRKTSGWQVMGVQEASGGQASEQGGRGGARLEVGAADAQSDPFEKVIYQAFEGLRLHHLQDLLDLKKALGAFCPGLFVLPRG